MNKLKLFTIFAALIFLSGCSSNKEMRKRFGNNEMRIFTDEAGRKYVVKHHLGDTYSVIPYEPENYK